MRNWTALEEVLLTGNTVQVGPKLYASITYSAQPVSFANILAVHAMVFLPSIMIAVMHTKQPSGELRLSLFLWA